MNYYEHHLGDFMRDTAHLTMVEECAYRRLLDAYYIRERALPGDVRECAKLARASNKPERDAVAYVLREFFELREDGHHQGRADKEIARFQEKREKARSSINQRWERERAKAGKNNERNTNVSNAGYERTTDDIHRAPVPRHQTPDTRHQTPEDTQSLSATAPARVSPAVAVCIALREAGVAAVNAQHPTLLALLEAGAEPAEFVSAAELAMGRTDPFAYLLGVVKGRRADAARVAQEVRHGPMPTAETPRQRAARERMEQIAPTAAAKRPGAHTAEVIDVATRRLG